MNLAHDEKDAKGELLPCPFCDGRARTYFKRVSNVRSGYFVECLGCGVRRGNPSGSPEVAAVAWNTRAHTTRIVADLEAKLANALHWKDLLGTKKAAAAAALAWAESHGEAVFAGGGWPAVNSMNEWAQALQGRSARPDAGENP